MKTKKQSSKKVKAKTKKSLGGLFGHSVTAVCRALGKAGFKTADVRAIMKAKRIAIADGTVSIQTRAGKLGEKDKGFRGEPAALTKDQFAELKALIPASAE